MTVTEQLNQIRDDITAQFPRIEAEVCQEKSFLHLWRHSLSGLDYLPNFHLIFEVTHDNFISVKLISFHGKTLDSMIIKEWQAKLSDRLIDFIVKYESFDICQGFNPKSLSGNYQEFFNDNLVQRSPSCELIAKNGSICPQCEMLIEDVKENLMMDIKLECDMNQHASNPPTPEDAQSDPEWEPLQDDEDHSTSFKLKHEEDLDESYHPDPDDEQIDLDPEKGTFELPVRKKRGRPPKPEKERKKPKPRVQNRAPKFRSTAEEDEDKKDLASGFREKCAVCLRSFKLRSALNTDLERHKKYFSVEGKANCPICNLEMDKLQLTGHFDTKHPSQTCCIVCMEVLPDLGDQLLVHIRGKHQIKPRCQLCGKVLTNGYWLEIHMKTDHNDDSIKDVFCDRCGKTFPHKIHLAKHLRAYCGGSEEWQCPMCPKMFDTQVKITTHLKVHCEEKPYICPLCNYATGKANNMYLHSRKVHHLKGCTDDFFVKEDVLKRQKEFVKMYFDKIKPRAKKAK